jgi:4-hydroxy-tetrahydrodipicolinate reductase
MAAHKPIRVAVAGARGKTGSVIAAALNHAPGIALVGRLVRPDSTLATGEYDDLQKLTADCKPDVLVDFTVFPASKSLAFQALASGVRLVIGTSGYTQADIDELREACRTWKTGAVYAPNFSIGAILMMQFSKAAAPYFTHADIIETHHVTKKDAPSGTALATAQIIAHAGRMRREPTALVRVEGVRGGEVGGVGIHSVRVPGAVGTQEVIFANEDETLVIRHVTATRTAFVSGVIKAIHVAARSDHFIENLTEFAQ